MNSLYYDLTVEELKDLLVRMKELAYLYSINETPDKCPLCQFDIMMKKKYYPKEILSNCKFCPWIIIGGIKCLEYWEIKSEDYLDRNLRLVNWSYVIENIILDKKLGS